MPNQRFETIERQSLPEALYKQLRDKIVFGVYQAGDRLPSERVLSQETGINRGAVREAVKRLQQAGLIAVRQGGNHEVLDFLQEAGPELLPSLLVTPKGSFHPKAVKDVMAMRSVLAPEMAFAAAQRMSPEVMVTLAGLCDEMAQHQADIQALQRLALAYWQHIAVACDNVAFRLSFNALRKSYLKAWDALTFVLAQEFQDLNGFQAMTRAIEARNAPQARQAAAAHIRIGQQAIETLFQES